MTRTTWQDAFVATSMLMGEPEEAIARALGRALKLPSAREARARMIAHGLAPVVAELEAMGRGPWRG